jgi:hypothetical protein
MIICIGILVIWWEVFDHQIYRPRIVGIQKVNHVRLWVPFPQLINFLDLVNRPTFNKLEGVCKCADKVGCVLVYY